MKKSKETKNKFRCQGCGKDRLRGKLVRVQKGPFSGYSLKTCQAEACLLAVKNGKLYPVTL